MLFATGMGAALLYWSTYEWLVYYTNPIEGEDQSLLKARSYPLFHWMFTGWALYILPTVAFVFSLMKNPNTPLTFFRNTPKRTIWTNKNFIRYLFYWCDINRSRCWSGTILSSYVSCYIKIVWT